MIRLLSSSYSFSPGFGLALRQMSNSGVSVLAYKGHQKRAI